MGQSLPKPGLRPFLPADVPLLAEIFQASIEELTGEDYSEGQQEAWAAMAEDESFARRLADGLTLIATIEGSPVGFIALKGNELIDLFYVHPAAAGHGVGAMLYEAIEKLAGARGAEHLVADVTDNARTFFDRRGFLAQRRNTMPIGDEWLGSTTMEKRFATQAEARGLSS
jgi:putative acetyltransferase